MEKSVLDLKPSEGKVSCCGRTPTFVITERDLSWNRVVSQHNKREEIGAMWHLGTAILLPQWGSSPLSYNPIVE